jgi:acetolactate synthase I/II/III large subunit
MNATLLTEATQTPQPQWSSMSTSRYLAEALRIYGVTHFFHVPVIVPVAMREMVDLGVTPVMTHGEKAAAYMADGYARASGRAGVCGAQAIGGTNLAAGLRDAYMSRIPVIALTGGKRIETQYRGQCQEIDDLPIFEAITKFNATVWSPERLPDLLGSAFRAATTGAPAPVHLEISGMLGDVGTAGEVTAPQPDSRFGRYPAIRPPAPFEDVQAAFDALASAERPVIVAGGGARTSGAGEELLALARRWSAPIVTGMNAKGIVAENDPLALGVVGEYSTTAANRAVYEADLVVYVGSQTGGLVTHNFSVPAVDARVVHIDIDPLNFSRNFPHSVGVLGDARTVLRQLLELDGGRATRSGWLDHVAGLKDEWLAQVAPAESSQKMPMTPQRLACELADALPDDVILVTDTGHAASWLSQNLRSRSANQSFLRSHGSLGWSFPAALGAQCAMPDRPVVCFTGDGGFYYHLSELETAVRYKLPVVVVVNNNASLNQEQVLWQGNPAFDHLWRMRSADFTAVAEAFGCRGVCVENPADVGDAVRSALASGQPTVIEAISDDAEMAVPAWGPAGSQGMYAY